MAAPAGDLDDIDEKFLQCAKCLEQLQELKQLPCLHRFCFQCLGKLLQKSSGVINCPECKEEIAVPNEGVDGFKTEFVRWKKSPRENTGTKECCGCSKMEQVSAYCFKCSGFLCEACDQFHRSDTMKQGHASSILDLNGPTILGLEKLSQLMDSPRCLQHPENIMRLCCVSCGDDPICVACANGDHGDHKRQDIKTKAREKKVKMKEKLKLLRGCENGIYQLQDEVKSASSNTASFFEKRKVSLEDCFKDQVDLIEQIRKNIEQHREIRTSEIQKKYERGAAKLDLEMEKEIRQIRDKYAILLNKEVIERDGSLKKIKAKSTHMLSILEEEGKNITRRFQDSEKSLQTYKKKTDVRSTKALQHSTNIIKRYENLSATASSILAADNDWTVVQCIPDICSAVQPLIEDMTNNWTALATISQSPPSEVLLPVDVSAFEVPYRKSIANIQCEDPISTIDGIVNVPGQGIIINGQVAGGGGYSLCINIQGQVLWKDITEYYLGIPQTDEQVFKLKAAVKCFPEATTMLDMGTQKKSIWGIKLSEIINHWPKDLLLQYVASDQLQKRIFAAFQDCRNIYVFNDKLNLVKTFLLPPKSSYPFALAVSVEGLLIVCDARGKRVFSTNIKGEVQFSCLLPFLYCCEEWEPQSLCSDSKDNVYVLLNAPDSRKAVVQYRKHGGHPIAFRRVSSEVAHVVVTQVDQEDHLILVGSRRKNFLVYRTTPYPDVHDEVKV